MQPTTAKLAEAVASTQAPVVHALIPAYGRPELLAAALASLRGQGPHLHGVIVVNNSRDAATERVAAAAGLPVRVLTPACNLGTAGGIALALQAWLADPAATHAWILDDDAVAAPGALDAMLAAAAATQAEAVAPLLTNHAGTIEWLPGLVATRARRAGRDRPTPEEFRRQYGEAGLEWSWALWASLLVSRRAVQACGFPQLELWSQFSDFEYTLRVTARFPAVLAPAAVCQHLPPPSVDGPAFDGKLESALQNAGYVTTRLAHGRRALRHLPGLYFRYLRHYRAAPRAWGRAARACWHGIICGRPSGATLQRAEVEAARAALARSEGGPA